MGGLARQLRFVFVGTVLVVAAFSTGLAFLFFLLYLCAALLIGAWLYARNGLRGVRGRLPRPQPSRTRRRGPAGRLSRGQRNPVDEAVARDLERRHAARAPCRAGPSACAPARRDNGSPR